MTDSTTTIGVVVFDKDDAGILYPVGDPQQFETDSLAVTAAKELASKHDGVIAWRREEKPYQLKDKDSLTILYKAGEAIDME
jgi:hypothetical protein